MAFGFDDFDIIVERCPRATPQSAWIWCVRRRIDNAVLTFGRSHGGRAEACADAAQAVFQLLAACRSSAEAVAPASLYQPG